MKQLPFLAALLLLALSACTDPITVGEDLLGGDRATLGQNAAVPFTTRTVPDEPVLTYRQSNNAAIGSFNLGRTTDDVFGSWNHGVTLTPALPRTASNAVSPPEFVTEDNVLVDSIVLILPLDTTTGFYGQGRTFDVEVRLLSAPVLPEQDYNSADRFDVQPLPINEDQTFTAVAQRRILYDTIYSRGDTIEQPHIRVRLNQQFVDLINGLDTNAYQSDSSFWEFFPGVELRITDESDGFVSILPQPVNANQTRFAGWYYFYPDPTENDPASFYRTGLNLWLPFYEKDYTGSLAQTLVDDGMNNDQSVIAGQGGLMTEITLTDLSDLDNTLINAATFTFYVDSVAGYDYAERPVSEFLGLYHRVDGVLEAIEDRVVLGNPGSNTAVQQFLGGDLFRNGDGRSLYQPRLSVHLQRILDGEAEPVLYLRNVPLDRDPSRVILRGPERPELGANLTVTFTRVE